MPSSRNETFSTRGAIRYGWDTTLSNLKPLLLIGLVGAVLGALNSSLTSEGPNAAPRALLALAVQVLQVGITLIWIRTALRLHDGQPVDLRHPGSLLGDFVSFLIASFLYGVLVAFGMVLLIVPGLYWGARYGLTTMLVADRKLDPMAAFRESARLTDGVKGDLLLFALVLLGVNILGAIPMGLGLFLTIPTSFLAAAHVFRLLQVRGRVRAGQPVPLSSEHGLPA